MATTNDPYAGMTDAQIAWLGGADPTDPYILARMRDAYPDMVDPFEVSRLEAVARYNQETQAEIDFQNNIPPVNSGGIGGTQASSGQSNGVMRDYQHASQLYIGDMGRGQGDYPYAPKHAFMFHLFFDFAGGSGDQTIGMLVKQCSLPKLTFETKTLNDYNRPYIIQTKVQYDPINITFHDDNSDAVRKFLFDYYKYYYADPEGKSDWGYKGQFVQFLSAIRIYSLSRGKFSEYTLVNPIIKNYSNGEHNSYDSAGIMQHQMTVAYETVLLSGGTTSQSSVEGFAQLNYDTTPSPFGKPAGYAGADTAAYGSNSTEYSIFSPGMYDKMYSATYSNPLAEAAVVALKAASFMSAGMDAINSFKNGDIVGGLFSAADALTSVNRLSASASSLMSSAESSSLGRSLTSANNSLAPISIPSVGSMLSSVGSVANGAYSAASRIGTSIQTLSGINPSMPVGGLGRLPEEISSYARMYDTPDTLLYSGVSNMQPAMPADMEDDNVVVYDSYDSPRTITGSSFA